MRIIDMTQDELNTMHWQDLTDERLTLEDLQHVAGQYDQYWACDPLNPGPYHAKWSSGLCAADFFNLKDTMHACEPFRYLIGYNLFGLLRESWPDYRLDAVVGSASGTTELVRAIADITDTRFLEMVKPEGSKDQLWPESQAPLKEGQIVGHFEELTSTFSTPPRVRVGIRAAHQGICEVQFAPVLTIATDRRTAEEYEKDPQPILDGSRAVCLTRMVSKLYVPGPDCPMCAAGSTPIRPREEGNWARLTGKA